ncbi:DUF5615 family PIN-like protein [Synechococcus sp. C9]|uniref:DUF5615 family PIN-like protein n=1 Tax=Synechococcus sp. C9 TaxID=102119 RepID=UPI001FF545D7|nr:DUF5615 family PIN-like protein [Synechococcus sp. C9]
MKFLVDEDCPLSLARLLIDKGHSAIYVKISGLSGLKDRDLFISAQKEQCIIISRDLGWANILTYPPNTHCGLVILRMPFRAVATEIYLALEQFLDQVDVSEILGAIVIIEPNKFRIRSN